MRKESVILSFIAVFIGILVAGTAFYFYQAAKAGPKTPSKTISIAVPTPTPTPSSAIPLTVDTPKDLSVSDKKLITVSGKTTSNATVVLTTPVDDTVLVPAADGSFSGTINIDDGENIVQVTSVTPDGQMAKIVRTVTYSTETF